MRARCTKYPIYSLRFSNLHGRRGFTRRSRQSGWQLVPSEHPSFIPLRSRYGVFLAHSIGAIFTDDIDIPTYFVSHKRDAFAASYHPRAASMPFAMGEASPNIGKSRIDETEKVEPRERSTMMAFAFNAFLYTIPGDC